jgi:alpha-ribazole phosphatase
MRAEAVGGLSSIKSVGLAEGRLLFLRHGAIQSHAGGRRYIGQTDVPLSAAGQRQADQWAAYFAATDPPAAIFCSDLDRCQQTARKIAARCGLESQMMPELREVDLGSWEGERFDTVKKRFPQAFQQRGEQIADHRPPGGESFRDLQRRAWPVFESLAQNLQGSRLIVTHAGVIRVVLCRLLGMPLENLFSIGQAYGALNIIEVRPGGCRVQAMNWPLPEQACSPGHSDPCG